MKNGYRYLAVLLMAALCVAMLSVSAFALDVDMGILEATVEAVEEAETAASPDSAEESAEITEKETVEPEESPEITAVVEEKSEVLNADDSVYVYTETELREALEKWWDEWPNEWPDTFICGDITLTEDLIIPPMVHVYLEQGTTLTVPEEITLANEGTIYVDNTDYNPAYGTPGAYSDNTVLCVDGTLKNQHTIVVGIYGDLVVNGCLEGNDIAGEGCWAKVYVACEDDMEIAKMLSEVYCCSVVVNYDITLKEDFVQENDDGLYIENNATLTVPAGVSLTTYNHVNLGVYRDGEPFSGILKVEGTFVNEGYIQVANGSVIGDGKLTGAGMAVVEVKSSDDLDVVDVFSGLYGMQLSVSNYWDNGTEILVEKDFTLGEHDELIMSHNAVLTVPEGVTLTNYGYIQIGNGIMDSEEGIVTDESCLKLEGTLVNHGRITVKECGKGIEIVNEGTVTGQGDIGVYARDEKQIIKYAEWEQARFEIYDNITLTEDITLKGKLICSRDAELTVAEGITLVNDGFIRIGETYGFEDENGEIEWYHIGGTLNVQGEFINNGRVDIMKLGKLILNGAAGGTGEVFSTMAGDTDGDGRIETEDLIKLMKYTAGVEMVDFGIVAADVTGDGVTDILDVIRLVRYLSGEDVELS